MMRVFTILAIVGVLAGCTPSPGSLKPGKVVLQKTEGLPVTGTVFGQGSTAVILASQGGTNESEWFLFARELAEAGFTALTLSSPDSQGDSVVLVKLALRFLRDHGFQKIVLAGASNGASGCAFNAAEAGVTGLLLVTYHGAADLRTLPRPKLFVAGELADPWRSTTEVGFQKAGEPKTLVLVPGAIGTGPSLLGMDPTIHDQVLAFLKACNGK